VILAGFAGFGFIDLLAAAYAGRFAAPKLQASSIVVTFLLM
jgi:hypothetical protein